MALTEFGTGRQERLSTWCSSDPIQARPQQSKFLCILLPLPRSGLVTKLPKRRIWNDTYVILRFSTPLNFTMSYLLLENVGFTRGLGERTPAGVMIGSHRSYVVFMLVLVVYIRGQQGTQRKFRVSHVRRSRVSLTFIPKER